jgi:hypothetical protein
MAYFMGVIAPLIVINIIAYFFRDELDKKGWVNKDTFSRSMFLASIGTAIGLYIINYM